MRAYLQPLVLVVALMGAGCTGSETSSTPAPLVEAELSWIRAYSAWTIAVYDEELGASPGPALVSLCRERRVDVGPPPTERLRPAAERVAAMCPLLGQRGSVRRALDLIDETDDLLRPLLLDDHELVLRSGVTNRSRADIEMSGYASELAGYPVEVRCWSPSDWKRAAGERNVWNDYDTDIPGLHGWQDAATDRIHMRLAECNAVSRLRDAELLSHSHDFQFDIADALDTFTHEVQHTVLPDASEADVQCATLRALGRFGPTVRGERRGGGRSRPPRTNRDLSVPG